MHKSIVIISNYNFEDFLKNINIDYQIFDESYYLINEYTLNDNTTFDYAIVSNPNSIKQIDCLKDGQIIICNYYFQTSKENIFLIGKENNSKKGIFEQFQTVINYLLGNN